MNRGMLFAAVAAVASLGAVGASFAAQGKKHAPGRPRHRIAQKPMPLGTGRGYPAKPRAADNFGLLQYDNDIPFSRDGSVGTPVGNRFDAGVVDPHTLVQITFRMAGAFSSYVPGGVRASIWDINPTGMTNMLLAQFVAPGPTSSSAGTVLWTAMLPAPILHVGPFVAALYQSPSAFCSGMSTLGGTCEGIALTAGGTDPGMGFHAIRLTNAGVTAQNLGTRNAIMRVQVVRPVELMEFDAN